MINKLQKPHENSPLKLPGQQYSPLFMPSSENTCFLCVVEVNVGLKTD